MEESIQQMTAAIASSDTEAFARFYKARFDSMYAEARRCTRRDESFCLDVVQDAMMRVIKSMSPMGSEGSLSAWLRTVVQCSAYDRLRAEARRARRERAAVQHRPPEQAVDEDLDEKLAWLRREWARLDQQQARLLVMRYRFGWTLRRIGEALGLKPGAVDGRLSRAVGELRSRAPEQFHDG